MLWYVLILVIEQVTGDAANTEIPTALNYIALIPIFNQILLNNKDQV